jgi:GT2 family glycosyltransferase
MLKLTISIVNYNAGDFLIRCVESIQKVSSEAAIEVYVVDNNSTDDSIEKLKNKNLNLKIKYILNKENLGFGKAHNQVLTQIKEGYVLILNPDVELKTGDLKECLDYLEDHPEVGAVTPEILLTNGEVDLTAHRGFPTPWASFKYFVLKDDSLYHLSKLNLKEIHEVDAITGAFFLTKTEVLKKVGFFDEDYFMYAEDIDLCFRIKMAGLKIMYLPTIKVLHHKGVSTGLKKHSQHITTATIETRKKMTNYFYSTMKIFYKKNLAKDYPFFINWLVYLGIDIKWWLAKRKLIV